MAVLIHNTCWVSPRLIPGLSQSLPQPLYETWDSRFLKTTSEPRRYTTPKQRGDGIIGKGFVKGDPCIGVCPDPAKRAPDDWQSFALAASQQSQLPIRFAERNRAFKLAARIQNVNFHLSGSRRGSARNRLPDPSLGTQAQRRDIQKLSSPVGAV